MNDHEKLFELKQDGWITACRKIDTLSAQLKIAEDALTRISGEIEIPFSVMRGVKTFFEAAAIHRRDHDREASTKALAEIQKMKGGSE